MKCYKSLLVCILLIFQCLVAQDVLVSKKGTMNTKVETASFVTKKVLPNGMTILVKPLKTVPKVSMQLWYNVGSKDEKSGEKGIAHLIEHMIFKGTQGKKSLNLSESDINVITTMLSGSCNAFTSYDYTGYLFNFPTAYWKTGLAVLADCMSNVAFKPDHLSSEMKAVIQELKMYRDRYSSALAEEMLKTIFPDHPYHYPIIGHKQDLWTVSSEDLRLFYKRHYMPNNATLVVVGDVTPEQVYAEVEKDFGAIPAENNYKRDVHPIAHDIISRDVTLYRDVQLPIVIVGYPIPGMDAGKEYLFDIASLIIGDGKGSRLYKKIVDEEHLATSIQSSVEDLFDASVFMVAFEPSAPENTDVIIKLIQQELDAIVEKGITEQELVRAVKKARMHFYSALENSQNLAYWIGRSFIATGDENYLSIYQKQEPTKDLAHQVIDLIKTYLRPAVAHIGKVLPLPENERAQWQKLQTESDEEDMRILSARIRTSPIEEPHYAKSLKVGDPAHFNFPIAQSFMLRNGAKVLYYNNTTTPKISIRMEFKARDCYDPESMQGLYSFLMALLPEGTEKYTATELADALESRGMALDTYPGGVSLTMLSEDLEEGLELLLEVLTKATFDEDEIEKVRMQHFAALKNFWDTPSTFAGQLVRQCVYKGHPYSKNALGSPDSIAKITRDDLMGLYRRFVTPQGTKIAIVGDLSAYNNLQSIIEKHMGQWQGAQAPELTFPAVPQTPSEVISYPINRDQVVLCFARSSIDRKNPDYDKLLLFDQIFGQGLDSRLYRLREQSGLFYNIAGSLVARADEQPGMVMVKTIVSLDRLAEAEKVIKHTIDTCAGTLKENEIQEARNMLVHATIFNFESNGSTAAAFLFLERYGFPADYFATRAQAYAAISLDQVADAAKKLLHSDQMVMVQIGRVGECAV